MKTVIYVIYSTIFVFALFTLPLVVKGQTNSFLHTKFTYDDIQVNEVVYRVYEDTHVNLTQPEPLEAQSSIDVSDDTASDDTHANSELSSDYTKKKSKIPYSALGVLPTSIADEEFSYGDDPLQMVYAWHGRSFANETFGDKALIFIHGGCWLNAYGYDHAKGMYHALAELGMGVYAIEYRRVGDEGGGWPGSLDDVTRATNIAVKRIEEEGRYTNIYIAGHSAGGHLAVLAAQRLSSVLDLSNANINHVIGLAAITDIQSYAMGHNSCQSATAKFMKGTPENVPTAYQKATPTPTLSIFPVTLLQGDADSIVPAHHAELSGASKQIIKDGGHFDWLHPESTSFDALLEVISEHDE
ncbi:alpha/beta hydrolase family protein [Alteromonas sp. S015]|uniref:alpha/beta hydrolase family protein n=1 Tax=Alteromonas sp. S015 TaxID=3117401 RepID=UPI002FE284A7